MGGTLYANPNFIAADPRRYPDYTTAEYASVDPVVSAGWSSKTPFVGRVIPGQTIAMPQSQLFDAKGTNIGLESLAPQKLDITVGQIVPFFFVLDVKGMTNAATGVVTINATWDGFTRSAQDFGYDTSKGILAAFVDMRESSSKIRDTGSNAKVDKVVWSKEIDPKKGDYIDAQIQVSGLDKDDYVVVEVWVALDETLPGGKVNSVVQAQMESARTGPIGGSGDKINNGTQTIPLKTDDALPKVVDLSVTKSDDPLKQSAGPDKDPDVAPGDKVTYYIAATNNSKVTAYGVTITDTLDPRTTFDAAPPTGNLPGGTVQNGVVTWNIGTLLPGQTVKVPVTVKTLPLDELPAGLDYSTPIANTARVSTVSKETNLGNNANTETTVVKLPAPPPGTPQADLSVVKSDNATTLLFETDDKDPTVTPGGTITYTIKVTHNGGDPATNVTLVDLLPKGVTFDKVISGTSIVPSFDPVTGKVTWALGTLNAGDSVTIQFTAKVDAGVRPGDVLLNQTSVNSTTYDPDRSNNSDIEPTKIAAPPGTGEISGTVFKPVLANVCAPRMANSVYEGVVVYLYSDDDGFAAPVAFTVTDAAGNYSFGKLQAGIYQVQFSKPVGTGYVDPASPLYLGVGSDASPTSGRTANLVVTENGKVTGVDAGLVHLTGTLLDTATPDVVSGGYSLNSGNQVAVVNGSAQINLNGAGSLVFGGDGNLNVNGNQGGQYVLGGAGDNLIHMGPNGGGVVVGGKGSMVVEGTSGNDIIIGACGHNNIQGLGGWDFIFGGKSNDTLEGNNSQGIIMGGGGNDYIHAAGANAILMGGPNDGTVSAVLNDKKEVVGLTNLSVGDVINATGPGSQIVWQKGDGVQQIENFDPAQGDKIYIYGYSKGTFVQADGRGVLYLDGNSALVFNGKMGPFPDSAFVYNGAQDSAPGVLGKFDPLAPVVLGPSIKMFWGTAGDDIAVGSDEATVFQGNGGNDLLIGGAGNDIFMGSGTGSDLFRGNGGENRVVYSFKYEAATLNLNTLGGVVVDKFDAGSKANLLGSDLLQDIQRIQFADGVWIQGKGFTTDKAEMPPMLSVMQNGVALLAPASVYQGPVKGIDYQFIGTAGSDVVQGSDANDFVSLGDGDDAVNGGAGNDVLDGGRGSNFLTGGAGRDIFFLDGRGTSGEQGITTWSTITDFSIAEKEQLAIWGWQAGTSKIVWSENEGAEGWNGATGRIFLDADNKFDMMVTFTGLTVAQVMALPTMEAVVDGVGLYWFYG